jgi:ribulose 1,5-bisphosphate carboxylase large subunit-like protein
MERLAHRQVMMLKYYSLEYPSDDQTCMSAQTCKTHGVHSKHMAENPAHQEKLQTKMYLKTEKAQTRTKEVQKGNQKEKRQHMMSISTLCVYINVHKTAIMLNYDR